jgi:C4-dicarboxylate-binding protein DctP
MWKLIWGLALGVLSSLVLLSGSAAAERLRCSHQFSARHHGTALIEYWAAQVERLSGGRLQVELVGNSALFMPDETINAVTKGYIECGFSLNIQWSRKLPVMYVTVAPFLMASPAIAAKWATSEPARFLDRKMREKGVQPVVWLFQSDRTAITSRDKHLITPQDFRGIVIRGVLPTLDKSLNHIGARIRPVGPAELHEALRVGVIDATLTDIAGVAERSLYDHQDHVVIAPMGAVYVNGYVSPAWFDRLEPDLQEALLEAGRLASAWSVPHSRAATTAAASFVATRGMKVHHATAAEIAALQETLLPTFVEGFLNEAGSDGRVVLDMIADLGGEPFIPGPIAAAVSVREEPPIETPGVP